MLLKNTLNQTHEKDKLDAVLQEVQIEKKLDGLKSYFENFLMTTQKHDDLYKIMENQKALEDRIKGIGQGTSPELEKQLQEMRELLLNSKNDNKDKNKESKEEMEKQLQRIKEENEAKMKIFTDQINLLKNSFADELAKLKEKKQPIIVPQEAVSIKFEPVKKIVQIEIPKVEVAPKPETPPTKPITPPKKVAPKKLFNAAELEDDLSIEEPPKPIVKKVTKKIEKPKPLPEEPQPVIVEPPKSVVLQEALPTFESMKVEKELVIAIKEEEKPKKAEPIIEPPIPHENNSKILIEKVKRSIDHRDDEYMKTPGRPVLKSVRM